MSDVRSRAGALGLMQLMPATGRLVARKIGLRLRRTRDILDIETNVSLGTAYLRQMLDKFDGNYMLATAAYNAGPGRSVRWAAQNSCMSPELWVEMIPFNETRKYVRRVMFYTSIFESRLGQRSRPLRLKLSPNKNCPFNNYTRREQNNPNG
jgi:soluble lytic murein transglycosylase